MLTASPKKVLFTDFETSNTSQRRNDGGKRFLHYSQLLSFSQICRSIRVTITTTPTATSECRDAGGKNWERNYNGRDIVNTRSSTVTVRSGLGDFSRTETTNNDQPMNDEPRTFAALPSQSCRTPLHSPVDEGS